MTHHQNSSAEHYYDVHSRVAIAKMMALNPKNPTLLSKLCIANNSNPCPIRYGGGDCLLRHKLPYYWGILVKSLPSEKFTCFHSSEHRTFRREWILHLLGGYHRSASMSSQSSPDLVLQNPSNNSFFAVHFSNVENSAYRFSLIAAPRI